MSMTHAAARADENFKERPIRFGHEERPMLAAAKRSARR
jgi:hypothetical protein